MQVNRFEAESIQEATQKVRKALGPDALILSTRRLGKGKRGAMGAMFEIWAVPNDPYRDVPKAGAGEGTGLSGVQADLVRIKEMLALVANDGGLARRLAGRPAAMDLYTRLVRGGISAPYVHDFLHQGGAFDAAETEEAGMLHERVIKEILKGIEVTDPFQRAESKRIVAAFVGPTGVGKTTTIAKLAADLALKQKRQVGLISIDNYRIGAMEQLKTYAAILGVPCFPAFSRSDLEFALGRMDGKDVILIDTAGQSRYDMDRMRELASLVGSSEAIKCHLLLSTANSETAMEEACRNFGRLHPCSYIFTKTDETKNRGVIVNQLMKSKVPVSFVTTGQRVPEDILKATKTGILSLVFE